MVLLSSLLFLALLQGSQEGSQDEGSQEGSQEGCVEKVFEEDETQRAVEVSFTPGVEIEINLTLSYVRNDTLLKLTKGSHLDIENIDRQIVLRLKFSGCKGATEGWCGTTKVQVSSIRRHNETQVQTVGTTQEQEFLHKREPNPKVRVKIKITLIRYEISVEGEHVIPVTIEHDHGYYNYIPFQTAELIQFSHFSNLSYRVCNTPDECEGVCLTCPPGTALTSADSERHNLNSTHFCKECSPGFYSGPGDNQAGCQFCQPGSWNDRFSSDRCTQCDPGTAAPEPSRSAPCEDCELGTFAAVPGADSCDTCGAGNYTEKETAATQCTPCESGTYSSSPTTCTTCPGGAVAPDPGATTCTTCESGTYSSSPTTCTTCPGGAVAPDPGATTCTTCAEGHYTPNMEECVKCGGSVVEGGSACQCREQWRLEEDGSCTRVPCEPGYKKEGDDTCSRCPAGSYSQAPDSPSCEPCSPGHYQSLPGQEGCLVCELGTFAAVPGADSCDTCGAGSYTEKDTAATQCTPCESGTYSSSPSSTCTPCDEGTAQHRPGASSCTPCTLSSFQPAAGATRCLMCHGTVDLHSQPQRCLQDVYECRAHSTAYPNIGNLSWSHTTSGSGSTTTTAPCQYGGTASRHCTNNRWGLPDLADCNTETTEKIHDLFKSIEAASTDQTIEAVRKFVRDHVGSMGPKDLELISGFVHQTQPHTTQAAKDKLDVAMQIATFEDALQSVVMRSTKDRIVSMVEEQVGYLVGEEEEDLESLNSPDISISVARPGSNKPPRVSLTQNTTYSVITYHSAKLFSADKETELITSEVFSVNLHGEQEPEFKVEVALPVEAGGQAECRWYDTGRGRWSTRGCYITARSGTKIHCQCNHLTSFAAFTSIDSVPDNHRRAQSVLSTLLFIVSIVACTVTLAMYIPIRSFRRRVIIQVELMEIFSLVLANITFISLAHAQHQSAACTGLVFGVQYLYLVTMAWSLVAALVFYRQIVNAVNTYGIPDQHTFLVSCVLCWTLPLVFPTFALLYSRAHDLDYVADMQGEFGCWIGETWKIYTFIAPILVIVFINTVIGVMVILVMLKASKKKNNDDTWEQHKRHLKSMLSLITIFGISFMLALFTYGPHAIAFQYIFIFLTCSQGIFIFVLFVPLRADIQTEWKTLLSSKRGKVTVSSHTESSVMASNKPLYKKGVTLRGDA